MKFFYDYAKFKENDLWCRPRLFWQDVLKIEIRQGSIIIRRMKRWKSFYVNFKSVLLDLIKPPFIIVSFLDFLPNNSDTKSMISFPKWYPEKSPPEEYVKY